MNEEPFDTTDAAASATELPPEQIAELQKRAAKADENWDRLLRVTADFENFKKRAARERTEAGQAASAALLQKLLPVLDNFEMAQAAAQTAQGDKLAALQTGIAMIQQQLKSILTEAGLEELDASGKPFDPAFHEAVSQHETDDDAGRPRCPATSQGLQISRTPAASGGRHRRQKTGDEINFVSGVSGDVSALWMLLRATKNKFPLLLSRAAL